jgi:hypothetical protein
MASSSVVRGVTRYVIRAWHVSTSQLTLAVRLVMRRWVWSRWTWGGGWARSGRTRRSGLPRRRCWALVDGGLGFDTQRRANLEVVPTGRRPVPGSRDAGCGPGCGLSRMHTQRGSDGTSPSRNAGCGTFSTMFFRSASSGDRLGNRSHGWTQRSGLPRRWLWEPGRGDSWRDTPRVDAQVRDSSL